MFKSPLISFSHFFKQHRKQLVLDTEMAAMQEQASKVYYRNSTQVTHFLLQK